MLKSFRKNLKKWKWVLLLVVAAFIITIFAVWGGGRFKVAGQQGPPWAALVDGEAISEAEYISAYRRVDQFYSRLYGERYDDMRKNLNLGIQVINELIEQKIIMQEARKLGITATPEDVSKKIMTHPAFMENGVFIGKERYERLLRATNRSISDFEREMRDIIIMEKWRDLIGDSIFISDQDLEKKYREYNEQISFDYIFLKPGDYEEDVLISDEEARLYYSENSAQYKKGESRRAKFITLSREEIQKEVEITENDIKNYYQDRISDFRQPEQVRAGHILIKTPPNATTEQEEQSRARAEEILKKIKEGESFEDLAKKFSEDEGSAKNGGDLGKFPRGAMDPKFEEIAFSTPAGEVSSVFKSSFGFHIVRVLEKIPAKLVPLEEARGRIMRQLQVEKTQARLQQKMNQIRNEIKEPEDFEKVAEKYELEIKDTGLITQDQSIPEIGTSLEFQKLLFSMEPFEVGGPVFISTGEAILKYIEKMDDRIPPFEEVKEVISNDLKKEKAIELAYETLEKAVSSSNGNLQTIAKKISKDVKKAQNISRLMPIPNVGKAPQFIEELFHTSVKESVGPVKLRQGVIFASIEELNLIDAEKFNEEKDTFRKNLVANQKEILIQGILENIRLRKSIEINGELIRQYGV